MLDEIGEAPSMVGLDVIRLQVNGSVELRDGLAIISVAGVGSSNVIEKGLASIVMDLGKRCGTGERCGPGERRGAGSAQQDNRK